ncbi:hypothetical protein D9M72_196500 [compost metagenome]
MLQFQTGACAQHRFGSLVGKDQAKTPVQREHRKAQLLHQFIAKRGVAMQDPGVLPEVD